MAYDAILNGAKALNFFGGNITGCFSGGDATYGWNWSFWQTVLEPLVQQLSASSPIAPALVNAAKAPQVTTGGTGTETMVRQGTSVDDLWLIAARNGAGTRTVTFKGLPRWAHRADVYTENRTVKASAGSFSDRFSQWDVHVYHFVEALSLFKVAPTRASVGAHVTLHGKGLAAAKSVSFGGVKGRFKIVSDNKLVATVPPKAKSGPDRRHLRPQAGSDQGQVPDEEKSWSSARRHDRRRLTMMFVDTGELMPSAIQWARLYCRAATVVDKIFRRKAGPSAGRTSGQVRPHDQPQTAKRVCPADWARSSCHVVLRKRRRAHLLRGGRHRRPFAGQPRRGIELDDRRPQRQQLAVQADGGVQGRAPLHRTFLLQRAVPGRLDAGK